MKEKDFHNYIETQDPERKAALRDRVHSRLPAPQQKRARQPAQTRRRAWIASLVTACVCCVAFCAIMLPVFFTKSPASPPDNFSTENPSTPTQPDYRYCYSGEYTSWDVDYTLKEYSDSRGLGWLYLDWYDIGEDIFTREGAMIDNRDDVIYWHETVTNGETGDMVDWYVSYSNLRGDVFHRFWDVCKSEIKIGDIIVTWGTGMQQRAMFQYGDYLYYVEVDEFAQEGLVLDVARDMILR